MKKIIVALALFMAGFSAEAQLKTPQSSPKTTIVQSVGLTDVEINYSRPSARGRVVFGNLIPFGKVWRTGANEANEISLFTDMYLGKTKVPTGIYTLYTIPTENECVIIINKDRNVWGAYTYNEKNDVARLTVPVTLADEYLEALSMVFTKADNGAVLNLGWNKVRLAIPFTK